MKVAIVTPVFPPYPGGIGVNAYYHALELSKRGIQVEVFTPAFSWQTKQKEESFPIHYLKPWVAFGKGAFLPQLFWLLKKIDIVHLYYPFFGGAEVVAFASLFFKFKFLLHYEMDLVGEGFLKKIFLFYQQKIFPKILQRVDLLLALSEDYFYNSDLFQIYKKLEKKPAWQVVPNGVDVFKFHPKNDGGKGNLPIQKPIQGIILFSAGLDRAHYFKGLEILLNAIKILADQKFFVYLKVAGEGELKKYYQNQAKSLGLNSLVEFSGLITHNDLPKFYQSGDLFVMPSLARTESFSIATAEAQACGLPAIVSNWPGMRVTIESEKTGFLVEPGDPFDLAQKIKMILQNKELAKKMGEAGRERMIKNFSWQVIGDKLIKIYQEQLK